MRTTVEERDASAYDGSLADWLSAHRSDLDWALARSGAVLLHGLSVADVASFAQARAALIDEPTPYLEQATPRVDLGNDVFTSTEFPPDLPIALHNENSYAMSWPARLLFGCLRPAAVGGATTVADVRGVLGRLSSRVVDDFVARDWRLVRNYGQGFGLPWPTAFGTSVAADVERYCEANHVRCTWTGPDELRTTQVRPAFADHPRTGETVWFNHVTFWHDSRLPPEVREMLVDDLGPEGLPFSTTYGDGGPIPDEVIGQIADAYEAEKLPIRWVPGDLLLLDNMLVAHGREAYEGDRHVVVAMGPTIHRSRERGDHARPS